MILDQEIFGLREEFETAGFIQLGNRVNSKSMPDKVKIPPHSKESEMMVLGSMLTNIDSLNIAANALTDSDFYFSEHKIVFSALKDAYLQDKPADVHLIAEELKRRDQLENVGGVGFLTTLAQYAGTAAYIEEYTELVHNKALLRRMILAAQEVEKNALGDPSDVTNTLDEAQKKFYDIGQSASGKDGVTIRQLITGEKSEAKISYLEDLQKRQEAYQNRDPDDSGIAGISTHFIDLDKMIGGLNPSNLMIIAGRPAMGKTAFAINVAENICFKNGMPVGIFSLEMTAEQILHRIICCQSEVESDKIKNGSLSGEEYQRVVGVVNAIGEHTMVIDDQPGLKITDLRARARRMREVYGIELLVIDYLQLLSGSGSVRSQENRQNEISEISRMLKNLARELNIPVICASQLSRKVDERQGHRPLMSDLRESGSIEQDSDIVMFLLRREYYDPYDKPGHAELIVGKNRHGGVGSVNLTFRKEIGQFANYAPITNQDQPEDDDAFAAFK